MELWQLRTFKAVAETGSFTRASEILHLSQPAVSLQIKSLESEIGKRLFLRSPDGTTLTEDGKLLLLHAKRILIISDQIVSEMDKVNDSKEKKIITVGSIRRGLENYFAWMYVDVKKIDPEVILKVHTCPNADGIIRSLEDKSIDIAICPFSPKEESIWSQRIGSVRVAVVAKKDHHLSVHDQIPAIMLERERWIVFERGDRLRRLADKTFKTNGIAPKSIITTNDGSVIADLLEETDIVSILPVTSVLTRLESGRLTLLKAPEFESNVELFLCVRNNDEDRAKTRSILECLANKGRPDGGRSIGLDMDPSFIAQMSDA